MIFQFENDDGDLLVDFLDITGLRVVTDSFSYTPLPDGTITSTFDVIMESTAETTRRAAVAQLEAKLKEVTNYHEDLLKQQAVWWRWHQDAEPPGRMLLHDFAITYRAASIQARSSKEQASALPWPSPMMAQKKRPRSNPPTTTSFPTAKP